MDKYQIFISYRRDGGDALAGRLADRFTALGYSVFFDVESMRSGTFNTQILNAIAQCDDVLLVLPPNGLDRCVNEDDWVRQELAFALQQEKNVIPIMMRNFEFPKNLPDDIAKISLLEGVEASQSYFDAVIERIDSLLTSTPAKNVKETAFPVYEDPAFPQDVIQDIILYYLLKKTVPQEEKSKVAESLNKYYTLHSLIGPKNEYTGLAGRDALHTVQYEGKWYKLYDVFYMNGQKYAYGLGSNINPAEQQIGAFFSIDDDDTLRLILQGDINTTFVKPEAVSLFSQYTQYRRGLGYVPDILLPSVENQLTANISGLSATDVADHIGLDKSALSGLVETPSVEAIETLKTTNKNLLYPHITGFYNSIGVFLKNGNCYGNRMQGFYAGKIINTPLKKKIVLDVVPTMIKGHYVALAYNTKKKKGFTYLLEGPEYYLITKDETGELSFEKISESNLAFWCEKYFERFALIYMQAKLLVMGAFLQK